MRKQVLDFVIIGAQKAGTTSLFQYMRGHPQLYMPPEKEAPYFNREDRMAQGWQWYLQEFFGEAPEDRLWGKATPDYMGDTRIPARIHAVLPDARLLAILRNPIDRAHSDYMMNLRRGTEQRSFGQVVDQLLDEKALSRERNAPSPENGYMVRGEYGRILRVYVAEFSREQIAVHFVDRLQSDALGLVREAFEFLGVDPGYVPDNLGTVYHRGGARARVPLAFSLRRRSWARTTWHVLPAKVRRRLLYWFDQWNVKGDAAARPLEPAVREKLIAHFASDVYLLTDLLGAQPPWGDWR